MTDSKAVPFASRKSPTASNSTNRNQAPKAEAFGNLVFVDSTGAKHKLPKGTPMDSNSRITRSIINKAKKHFEETGEELVITVTMQVHLVNDDTQLDDVEI